MNKRQFSHKTNVIISKNLKVTKKLVKRIMPTMKAVPRWREIRHAKNRTFKKYIEKGILPENYTEILYNRIADKIICKRRFLK